MDLDWEMALLAKLRAYVTSKLRTAGPSALASMLVLTLALLMSVPTTVAEDSVSFQMKAYGASRTVIMFTGATAGDLNTALDPLGTSIRISAAGTSFTADSEIPKDGLVSYVQQVTRGGYEDLVITLKQKATLTESRSDGMLKLFLSRAEERQKPSPTPAPESVDSSAAPAEQAPKAVAPAVNLPVRFFTSGIPNEQNQLIIAFPPLASEEDPAFVATLRGVAYFSSLMSGWLTERDFKIERPGEGKSGKESEELINALTAEVVDLRKQLSRAQQQLKKLNGAATNTDVK